MQAALPSEQLRKSPSNGPPVIEPDAVPLTITTAFGPKVVVNPDLVKELQVEREQRFSDVESGKALLVEYYHAIAPSPEIDRARGAAGTATDDPDVERLP